MSSFFLFLYMMTVCSIYNDIWEERVLVYLQYCKWNKEFCRFPNKVAAVGAKQYDHIVTCVTANQTSIQLKKQMDIEVNRLQQKIADENLARGTTYVRWSRKQCPNNRTELVYSGYAGGGKYDETGSAAEPVCLPQDPDFVTVSGHGYGHMFGAEFESNLFASNSNLQDIPCAVCRVRQISSVIMIPGKNRCYTGWNMEYYGHLASNHYNHAAAGSYVCIDIQPEYVIGGSSWSGQSKLFYDVKAKCGSLKCPPYKQDYTLTCVVCSK